MLQQRFLKIEDRKGTEMSSKNFFKFFAVILLFFASFSAVASWKKPVFPGIGMNSPGLLSMYLGTALANSSPEIMEAMAHKAMVDAHNNGIGYFRISASGFGGAELELWQKYPDFYWSRFDKMMFDLQENQIMAALDLPWWNIQFPRFAGDSMHNFFVNPDSASRKLCFWYIWQTVNRYKGHPALLFWQMGNEWNLDADLDIDSRTGSKGDNYSTNELLDFMHEYANFVRGIDSEHPISNGFSMPRPAAEHLRKQPEWSPKGPDWTSDTREDFRNNLIDATKDVEIMSVHFYNLCANAKIECDTPHENERFDIVGRNNPDLLDEVAKIANETGKMVFVGETGDDESNNNFSVSPFLRATLERIGSLKILFSALWDWEGYISPTLPSYSNIEPGFSDALISKVSEVNNLFFNRPIPEPRMPDHKPPIVIITSPLAGKSIPLVWLGVYAVASDNDRVDRVEFWLNNTFLGEVKKAPYRIELAGGTYPVVGRTLKLKAKAFDFSGNSSEFVIHVSGFSL